MARREKSALRKLIDERGIKDLDGVYALVKELTSGLIQEIMDAELEDELGVQQVRLPQQANQQQPQRLL